jgi:threonine/homoserine/homoserine lactone efflux protein
MTGLDLSGLLVFTGALLVAAVSPGPGVAALVARVLGRGPEGAVAFAVGMGLGDIVWLGAAVLGLSVLAETFHEVFVVIKFVGAAYLLYLAWRLWTAPVEAPDARIVPPAEKPVRLFFAGLTLMLSNPKVMAFYLALLPSLLDLLKVDALAFAELAAVVGFVLTLVYGGYIVLALRARRFMVSARRMKLVNRGSGVLLAGAAVAVATR